MILIDTKTTQWVRPTTAGGAEFEIRALTGAEFRNVAQVYARGEDGGAKACAYALVSWRGIAVKTEAGNAPAPLNAANVDRLPAVVIDEVAAAIFTMSRVSEEDKSGAAHSSTDRVG